MLPSPWPWKTENPQGDFLWGPADVRMSAVLWVRGLVLLRSRVGGKVGCVLAGWCSCWGGVHSSLTMSVHLRCSHLQGALTSGLCWGRKHDLSSVMWESVECTDLPVQKPPQGLCRNLPCSCLYLCHCLLQLTLLRGILPFVPGLQM